MQLDVFLRRYFVFRFFHFSEALGYQNNNTKTNNLHFYKPYLKKKVNYEDKSILAPNIALNVSLFSSTM